MGLDGYRIRRTAEWRDRCYYTICSGSCGQHGPRALLIPGPRESYEFAYITDKPLAPPVGGWPWWTINGESLMRALTQAHHGEDPTMVYAELYANSQVEDYRAD
jgi:hypothetical protein